MMIQTPTEYLNQTHNVRMQDFVCVCVSLSIVSSPLVLNMSFRTNPGLESQGQLGYQTQYVDEKQHVMPSFFSEQKNYVITQDLTISFLVIAKLEISMLS